MLMILILSILIRDWIAQKPADQKCSSSEMDAHSHFPL